jgi:hypothetical protein
MPAFATGLDAKPPGVIGTVLAAIALFVIALVAEGHGYRTLSSVVVVVVGALVIGLYAMKSRSRANRT